MRAAILLIAIALAGCALPPERNPPPAYQAPAQLEVLIPSADTPHRAALSAAASLAATRLNRSRSPTERPVRIRVGPGAVIGVRTGAITVIAAAVQPYEELLIDPRLPAVAVESEESIYASVAMYDAVLVAGMAARQGEQLPEDWLRAQPGWRLGLGVTHFRDHDSAPTGTRFTIR